MREKGGCDPRIHDDHHFQEDILIQRIPTTPIGKKENFCNSEGGIVNDNQDERKITWREDTAYILMIVLSLTTVVMAVTIVATTFTLYPFSRINPMMMIPVMMIPVIMMLTTMSSIFHPFFSLPIRPLFLIWMRFLHSMII